MAHRLKTIILRGLEIKYKENRKIFIPEVKGNSNNSNKETVKDNDVAKNNIENIVENDNDE